MYFAKAPNDCGFVAYGCVDRIRGIPALRACFNDAVRQTRGYSKKDCAQSPKSHQRNQITVRDTVKSDSDGIVTWNK